MLSFYIFIEIISWYIFIFLILMLSWGNYWISSERASEGTRSKIHTFRWAPSTQTICSTLKQDLLACVNIFLFLMHSQLRTFQTTQTCVLTKFLRAVITRSVVNWACLPDSNFCMSKSPAIHSSSLTLGLRVFLGS